MISKLIKKALVVTFADSLIAYLYHLTGNATLKRLIPGPPYYSQKSKRTIKRYGAKYKVYPADQMQWDMFADNSDGHIAAATKMITSEKGVILDVGANIGQFSIVLAQYIKKNKLGKNIVAFEPNPKICDYLIKNIEINKSLGSIINVQRCGAGEKDETLFLHAPLRNSGAGTLTENYNHEPHDEFIVEIKRLDDLVKSKVDFIKLDVENFEYYALLGAQQILTEYRPPVYFETSHLQPNQSQIFQMFENIGYSFMLEKHGKFFALPKSEIIGVEGLFNVLAYLPQKPDAL